MQTNPTVNRKIILPGVDRYQVMEWIYLSPHYDDAALSCGGLIWEQIRAGEKVSVWTICAGEPPLINMSQFAETLHSRWKTGVEAVRQRKREDLASCTILGATLRHFTIPDCIYRRGEDGQPLYDSEQAIYGDFLTEETPLRKGLNEELKSLLQEKITVINLVCPLTVGHHVDHQLVRSASESLGCPLWYYADYPYVVENASSIPGLLPEGAIKVVFPVSEKGLDAWVRSIAVHDSQVSTFWTSIMALRADIQRYRDESGGIRLWRSTGTAPTV